MMCATLFGIGERGHGEARGARLMQGVPDVHEMIPAERRARIVEILKERGAVRVSSLSDDLGVSEMTIRRDLERLGSDGVLSRTHGGAILKRHMAQEPLYTESATAHTEQKERLARAAAALIRPGDTVFLSSGTTAARVLRHVDPTIEARIITENVGAVAEAQGRLEVILLGGVYRPRSNTLDGPLSVELVARFHAATMILGVDGCDLEEGMTTPSVGIASVERAMIAQTRGDIIVLADSSKIGVVADVVICGFDQVDVVMVDDGVDSAVRDEMTRLGVKCVVV